MTSKVWRSVASVAALTALAAVIAPTAARAASPQKPRVVPVAPQSGGGMTVSIDPTTGRIRSITPAEAKQLVSSMTHFFSRPITASDVTHHADGTISVDLSGSFQNVSLARLNGDGSVGNACVDNEAAAYEFFLGGSGAMEEK